MEDDFYTEMKSLGFLKFQKEKKKISLESNEKLVMDNVSYKISEVKRKVVDNKVVLYTFKIQRNIFCKKLKVYMKFNNVTGQFKFGIRENNFTFTTMRF